jgi:hypothetical protein
MISLYSRSHGVGARGARVFSIVLLLFLVLPVSASTRADATRPVPQALPLIFELNAGQTSSDVKFLSRGPGYTLFLTPAEMVLGFATSASQKKTGVLRMQLPGANLQPRITGVEELPGKVNYFIGDDPAQWRTNLPTYAKVRYESIYPGVDLIYYGNQRQFEYDFVVAPGADPKAITLAFEGPDKLEMDAGGDLVFRVGSGELRLRKPLVYQEVDGSRKLVAANYVLRSKDRVGIQVAAHDARPLIIDPYSLFHVSGRERHRHCSWDRRRPGHTRHRLRGGRNLLDELPHDRGEPPAVPRQGDRLFRRELQHQSKWSGITHLFYLPWRQRHRPVLWHRRGRLFQYLRRRPDHLDEFPARQQAQRQQPRWQRRHRRQAESLRLRPPLLGVSGWQPTKGDTGSRWTASARPT